MPGRDRTGPEGKGPQSGRGLGPCGSKAEKAETNEKNATSEMNEQDAPGRGRGFGRGRGGGGRGFGRGGGRGGGQGGGRGRGFRRRGRWSETASDVDPKEGEDA